MPTPFLPESALASAESRIAYEPDRARSGSARRSIPYAESIFEIEFNFNEHLVKIITGDGLERRIPLEPRTVAEFYALVIWDLNHLKIPVKITELPSEIPGAIPFSQDRIHCAYDPAYANRFWRALEPRAEAVPHGFHRELAARHQARRWRGHLAGLKTRPLGGGFPLVASYGGHITNSFFSVAPLIE